jgi:hypothetical protein
MGVDCLALLGFHGYITYNLQLMWPWKPRLVLYCRAKKDINSVMYPWEPGLLIYCRAKSTYRHCWLEVKRAYYGK